MSAGTRIRSSESSRKLDEERFLPIANVSRIMKKSVPANAKISKEAKERVQECVSELISFVTGEAWDKCQKEKRKTINGDDLLWALTTLGFENYVGPLKDYHTKYRETETESMDGNFTEPKSGFVLGFDVGTDPGFAIKGPGFAIKRTNSL